MATEQSRNRRKKPPIEVGWREWVSFPNYHDFSLKAKIDTGARSSALHATHIKEFEIDSKDWVSFRIYQSGKFIYVERPITGYRVIKSSIGKKQVRPVIRMKIKLGTKSWFTDVTLTRRSGMSYPVLIGRLSLANQYRIHPRKSFLFGHLDGKS
jgi:hypothetical protein